MGQAGQPAVGDLLVLLRRNRRGRCGLDHVERRRSRRAILRRLRSQLVWVWGFGVAVRIRVCDLETTGFEATDHVVEIAAYDLEYGKVTFVTERYVKPPVPIPPVTSAIHHIIDEDVTDAKPWAEVYPQFIDDKLDAYAAHNSRFEAQWLTPTVLNNKPLIDTYRAALRLWPDAPGHSNGALRYWLKPEGLNRSLAKDAHRAGADAYVTAHLLNVIMKQPKVTLDGLIKCSQRPALLPKVGFGEHFGKKWSEVPIGYLEWMMTKDFDEDEKFTATHWLKKAVPAS